MCTPYVGRGPLNTTQIIFSVKILEALDNQIRSLSLCVYLGSFFTSNLIYADNNAETETIDLSGAHGSVQAALASAKKLSGGPSAAPG
jgi:hypothetical protein